MKADTQYNDFIGTAAADISDHTDLEEFLRSMDVDTEVYVPVGASFYHGYGDFISVSFICIDTTQSKPGAPFVVQLYPDREISHVEFFDLFKRFNVIVTKKYGNYESMQIQKEISIR